MSSSDGTPEPDIDDPGGLLSWSANRIDNGWGIGKFVKSGIGLIISGVVLQAYDFLSATVGFLTNPLETAGQAASTLFEALVSAPASIVTTGADQSAEGIDSFFVGILGPFAFPVGVASVIGGLWVLSFYLEDRQTSDLVPGTFTNYSMPGWVPFVSDPGTTEEGEDQEQ
jgi:hypothetical protein